ncbi:hypothetical protein BKA62DRAFT_704538, partial [Auriculariales sp. MPI-PUGE-AT-0066]
MPWGFSVLLVLGASHFGLPAVHSLISISVWHVCKTRSFVVCGFCVYLPWSSPALPHSPLRSSSPLPSLDTLDILRVRHHQTNSSSSSSGNSV